MIGCTPNGVSKGVGVALAREERLDPSTSAEPLVEDRNPESGTSASLPEDLRPESSEDRRPESSRSVSLADDRPIVLPSMKFPLPPSSKSLMLTSVLLSSLRSLVAATESAKLPGVLVLESSWLEDLATCCPVPQLRVEGLLSRNNGEDGSVPVPSVAVCS